MPAVSEKQRKLFGMALSYKRGKLKDASEEIKNLANSMSEKKLSDFASKIKKENKMKMTELIKIIREVIKDEESLEEITTTGTEQGSEEYNTPQAFSSNKKDKEKRNKKMANMINWKIVEKNNNQFTKNWKKKTKSLNEEITSKDWATLKKIIRMEIASLYFTLYKKRNVWMKE